MISIIIPTYNRSEYIKKAIVNAASQTFQEKEIIVVDDNGLNSAEQLKTYFSVSSVQFELNASVKYFALPKNCGAGYARNYGVFKSSGEYISFLDDDDEWNMEKLQIQYDKLSLNTEFSFCYCQQLYTVDRPIFDLYFGNLENRLHSGNIVGGCSNPLIRKSNFIKVNGFDCEFVSCQDWDLWVRLLRTGDALRIENILVKIDNEKRRRISTNYKNGVKGQWQFLKKHYRVIISNPYTFIIFSLKFTKRLIIFFINYPACFYGRWKNKDLNSNL